MKILRSIYIYVMILSQIKERVKDELKNSTWGLEQENQNLKNKIYQLENMSYLLRFNDYIFKN